MTGMFVTDKLALNDFLQRIVEADAVGIDLRNDLSTNSLYYQIKDARNLARTHERNSVVNPDERSKINSAWELTARLASNALLEQTKDLEIAAWLTEAWLRLYQFAGLAAGYTLLNSLISHYWENLYPLGDDDGEPLKLASVMNLNGSGSAGTLIVPINSILFTKSDQYGQYAFWQYQQALELSQVKDEAKRQRRIAEGAITLEQIEKALADTPAAFLQNLFNQLQAAIAAFKLFNQAVSAYSNDFPSSNILNTLTDWDEALRFLAKEKLGKLELKTIEAAAQPSELPKIAENPATAVAFSTIESREQAFKIINEVAHFFRATEPHSPLSYALNQVLRWGSMSLPQLLDELIPDDQAKANFFLLTGIEEVGEK